MQIRVKIPSKKILQLSVFIYPTETCYGLGCDALNQKLVKRIYQIKGRNFNKPVSWLVANIKMAKQYVNFSPKALKLAQEFWPGPLTLVLPAKRKQTEMIALRVSSHPTAQAVVEKLNKPLVATSANLSGQSNCYSAREVIRQFINQKFQPDFIIDAGSLIKTKPSTVIKIAGEEAEVLREGEVAFSIFKYQNKMFEN